MRCQLSPTGHGRGLILTATSCHPRAQDEAALGLAEGNDWKNLGLKVFEPLTPSLNPVLHLTAYYSTNYSVKPVSAKVFSHSQKHPERGAIVSQVLILISKQMTSS